MAAKTEWLITANGKEWGPFSSSQLKQLAQQGRVVPEMLIRRATDERPFPRAVSMDCFERCNPPTPDHRTQQQTVNQTEAAICPMVRRPPPKK